MYDQDYESRSFNFIALCRNITDSCLKTPTLWEQIRLYETGESNAIFSNVMLLRYNEGLFEVREKAPV